MLRVSAVNYPSLTVKSANVQVIDAILSGMRYPSGLLHERLRGQELVYVVHVVPMKMGEQDFLFLYALTEPHQVELVNTIVGQTFRKFEPIFLLNSNRPRLKSCLITSQVCKIFLIERASMV